MSADQPADPAELMALAMRVAAEAVVMIVAGNREGAPVVQSTKSSATDIVTAMDNAVEDLLVQRLLEARPDDGTLGEEHGFAGGTSGITWVLDPIDGTVNYLYGRPDYCVSVAAVLGDPRVDGGWTPVAACVAQPVTGLVWTAAAGQGAWLGERRLRLAPPPEAAKALVNTGFGYLPERRAGQARVVSELLPLVRDIRRGGSSALDLCSVATGTADAYYERGVNVWDVAAAALVVIEAGGVFRGLRGAPASPAMVLAAASPLSDTLAQFLADIDADSDPPLGTPDPEPAPDPEG